MVHIKLSALSALLTAITAVSASPSASRRWTDFAVKDARRDLPSGWKLHSRAPADHAIDLRIALRQSKVDELVKRLYEVSDPGHADYRKHLTKEQVEDLVKPEGASIDAVHSWLDAHGIDISSLGRSAAGDWLSVTVPVSIAEKMLDTTYNVYQHDSGSYVVRAREYSLPRSLHDHIDLVQPTTYISSHHEKKSALKKRASTAHLEGPGHEFVEDISSFAFSGQASVPASCGTTITPACLRALYNTVDYVPAATDKNVLGIAGYLNEYANKADLQTFFKKYRTDAVGRTFTTVTVNGGKDDQSDPGVEANLDIQYTEGISTPTPNVYWSTGGSPPFIPDSQTPTNTNEPYLDWLNFLTNQTSIPQTITTSYGDDEQTVPFDYAVRVCNTFAQLGARGISVLFSSGDFGVGGGSCKTNDGKNKVQFQPTFPGACPFITSVGGTTKVSPEKAVSFSQGGFSNYFASPSYQKTAVAGFLSTLGSTYSGLYNATGRGFPDVAAQGQGFQVVIGGITQSVGGTSASSPTFAAVVSLLNDYLLSQGKPTLGFLNPWLYSNATSALNDIVSGSNPGCGTNGFTARAGWDPVTGLGTPDFLKLKALL
jgi:tripeptidyl-peptidase-1